MAKIPRRLVEKEKPWAFDRFERHTEVCLESYVLLSYVLTYTCRVKSQRSVSSRPRAMDLQDKGLIKTSIPEDILDSDHGRDVLYRTSQQGCIRASHNTGTSTRSLSRGVDWRLPRRASGV